MASFDRFEVTLAAIGEHRMGNTTDPKPEFEFLKNLPSWFAAVSGLVYMTGFIIVFFSLSRFGLLATNLDFFKLKYLYAGVLFLMFLSIAVTPVLAILDKLNPLESATEDRLEAEMEAPKDMAKRRIAWSSSLIIVIECALYYADHVDDNRLRFGLVFIYWAALCVMVRYSFCALKNISTIKTILLRYRQSKSKWQKKSQRKFFRQELGGWTVVILVLSVGLFLGLWSMRCWGALLRDFAGSLDKCGVVPCVALGAALFPVIDPLWRQCQVPKQAEDPNRQRTMRWEMLCMFAVMLTLAFGRTYTCHVSRDEAIHSVCSALSCLVVGFIITLFTSRAARKTRVRHLRDISAAPQRIDRILMTQAAVIPVSLGLIYLLAPCVTNATLDGLALLCALILAAYLNYWSRLRGLPPDKEGIDTQENQGGETADRIEKRWRDRDTLIVRGTILQLVFLVFVYVALVPSRHLAAMEIWLTIMIVSMFVCVVYVWGRSFAYRKAARIKIFPQRWCKVAPDWLRFAERKESLRLLLFALCFWFIVAALCDSSTGGISLADCPAQEADLRIRIRTMMMEGGWRVVAYVAMLVVAVWKTITRWQAENRMSGDTGSLHWKRGVTLAVGTSFTMVLFGISVLGFASRVYPYIPAARGGGDYTHTQIAELCLGLNDTNALGGVFAVRQCNKSKPGKKLDYISEPLVIIEHTASSLFVAKPQHWTNSYPTCWQLITGLPQVSELPASLITGILYHDSTDTNYLAKHGLYPGTNGPHKATCNGE